MHQLFHTQLALANRNWAPSAGCTPSTNWSESNWWSDTPSNPGKALSNDCCRLAMNPVGPHPGVILAVGRRVELRCKGFLRGGPVHLPRAHSGRIHAGVLCIIGGLRESQLAPGRGQCRHTRIHIRYKEPKGPSALNSHKLVWEIKYEARKLGPKSCCVYVIQ
ncbi:hypothetical protein CLF_102530, partial [Clonorchis sinensis]